MTIGLVFWILMLLWLVFSAWGWYGPTRPGWYPYMNSFLLFILFLLLGWKVFGPPIHG